MANPIELDYPQLGRTVYCIRVSSLTTTSPSVYNTSSQLYVTYNASDWASYIITLSEVIPGIYRAVCPAGSLTTPATEYFYDQLGASPDPTNDLKIGTGNSQGVNIGTINGVQSSTGSDVSTDVDICNLALTHLGQAIITTLDDAVENARKCKLIYNNCRDEVLRSATWKFAKRSIALTDISDTTTVPTGWTYVYSYPSDCIYVRKAFIDDTGVFSLPFFVEMPNYPTTNPSPIEYDIIYFSDLDALGIVSNVTPLNIEYTARMANSSLYDSKFKKALSYKLAAELADILTGAQGKGEKMQQMYQFVMSDAAANNANETGVIPQRRSAYFDAR